jgi:2-methylcitrate dehydratase PrpD
MHPAIDAAMQLRNQYQLKPDQIDTINLQVNPLVLELPGRRRQLRAWQVNSAFTTQ